MKTISDIETKPNYEGWKMVGLLFLIYSSSTVSTNCLSLFYPKLKEEFGWTNAQVVLPNAMYFIYIALLSPVIGFVLTKITPKKLIITGVLLAVVLTIWFSVMTTYLEFHLIFFLFSLAIACGGMLPSLTIINNWFYKKKGLATGLLLIGSSFGGIVLPQIARYFIDNYTWRIGGISVAISAFLLGIIPVIFLKNSPNEEKRADNIQQEYLKTDEIPFSYQKLLTSPLFILLIFITASFWFCGFGILQNLILYLTQDCHFTLLKAAGIMGLFSINSMIGKITFGYLSDRYNKITILSLTTISIIIGLILLQLTAFNSNFAYPFAVAYGVGYSGAFTMIQVTVSEFYRGPHFSKVLGVVSSLDAIGGFLGVFLMGKLSTHFGSYEWPIYLLILVATMALILSFFLKSIYNKQISQKA